MHLGSFGIRWYSLCWLLGLGAAYCIVRKLYKDNGIAMEKFEPLFLYCFIGILVGARLGHCVFYEPGVFLTSAKGWIEMFIPVRLAEEGGAVANLFTGNFKFIGYEGLASHGGTLGLMLALWLYCRHQKMKKLLLLDFIAIATPITACMIRVGNFFNSEIVGRVTDVPWAVVFMNNPDDWTHPRHPAQLYEAMAYLLLLIIGWVIYSRNRKAVANNTPAAHQLVGTGFFFGLCLTYIFLFRFFIEFVKENQVGFENTMAFNMGQLLSLPFVALGLYCLIKGLKK